MREWVSPRMTTPPSPRHVVATLDKFKVPEPERGKVLAFIASLESQIVEK
jgi:hypothetical protein